MALRLRRLALPIAIASSIVASPPPSLALSTAFTVAKNQLGPRGGERMSAANERDEGPPPFDESALFLDTYNGVTLRLEKLEASHDPDAFSRKLERALETWKAEGKRGIWIHATASLSHLIPCCTRLGFDFHSIDAKGKDGDNALVLTRWLPEDHPSKLPRGPTHQVGIGAVVFHPSDPARMLVVKERTGPAAAAGLWKMPTGLLDPGEYVGDAAVRELKEETGLDAAAVEGILSFRQSHSEGRPSDMFFVCMVTIPDALVGTDGEVRLRPQVDEIADIRWMPVEEYCGQSRWLGSPLYESMNETIQKASLRKQERASAGDDAERNAKADGGLILIEQLPVGYRPGTNALFRSQL